MDADEIVLEYLRGKLGKARGARAEGILKPAPPPEAAGDEMPPEDLAQLEALMSQEGGMPPEAAEACPQCGAVGGCDCMQAE